MSFIGVQPVDRVSSRKQTSDMFRHTNKLIRSILFSLLSIFSQIAFCGESRETKKINKMLVAIENAIANENSSELLKYVPPSGIYFGDGRYSYAEVEKSIGDQNGWLYRHLFVGEKSVKIYFQEAKNLKSRITYRSKSSIQVIFETSNNEATKWVDCCFFKIKNKWYFDGIFYCG